VLEVSPGAGASCFPLRRGTRIRGPPRGEIVPAPARGRGTEPSALSAPSAHQARETPQNPKPADNPFVFSLRLCGSAVDFPLPAPARGRGHGTSALSAPSAHQARETPQNPKPADNPFVFSLRLCVSAVDFPLPAPPGAGARNPQRSLLPLRAKPGKRLRTPNPQITPLFFLCVSAALR
jgi:hypothetical protein